MQIFSSIVHSSHQCLCALFQGLRSAISIPAPLVPGRSAGGGSSSSLVLPALHLNATTH